MSIPSSSAPCIQLSEYGNIVKKCISGIDAHYNGVSVDNYAIMPNHVHMIIAIKRCDNTNGTDNTNGAPGSSRPTGALIPVIIAAFKKLTNKEFGFCMWQDSYHDHIIRNETEYTQIWRYIDENPAKWAEDCYNGI